MPMRPPGLKRFQSLSGFLVRCNCENSHYYCHAIIVSIPIGFSGSLQPQRTACLGFSAVAFQSLSGFLVRCNVISFNDIWQRQNVSIPIGFSGSLQPAKETYAAIVLDKFQSLSGFLVRCNIKSAVSYGAYIRVSIPIGFSGSLQLHQSQCMMFRKMGFNPYRVFWFAATRSTDTPLDRRSPGFNPYRVFWFAATYDGQMRLMSSTKVSIPIGFSGSLQLLGLPRVRHIYTGVSIPIGFSGSLQPEYPREG